MSQEVKGARSIREFCADHDLSVSGFYALPPAMRPKTMKVGRRRLVSDEAAAEWRKEMEKAES